ncbi:hypothetical protein M406DRAFT_345484 [Cryphonectria parasitica EP155]|uniref:Uncharacterized protein n=1 Tax=Cryphonectria parasitica (strain ATCC 38755 / EP155) TaxID=660469 RepID=A0A9P4Y706_CRYP1|nr:uncharacterized protein M406DRAFT_345484 [Cryphonectria parasitica EP155]KAF3767517.1 hypothetical protein M406DRAFT_345484 [Cryphonectria parasitica EP155]
MAFRDPGQNNYGPIGKLVQGLAVGVGLASESIQHHKEKKQQKKLEGARAVAAAADDGESPTQRDLMLQDSREDEDEEKVQTPRALDEAAWQLDDMQAELSGEVPPPPYGELDQAGYQSTGIVGSAVDEPALAASFIGEHPLPSPSAEPVARRLDLPVILTQRRPKARTRGFVRAYAPILEDVGIDQPTFLDFINKLNKAMEPSPWIQTINLASFAAQHVPEPVTVAVSIACKIAADAAAEVHSRSKTNKFLDTVNEDFFRPRGLVAILMTWKPSDPSMLTDVDFNLGSKISSATSTSEGQQGSTLGKLRHRMQASSGTSSFEFPETAPLIFPALDELAASRSEDPDAEAKKQNAVKRGGQFLQDYLDRRAVAKWAGDNPDSKMANAQPKPEFRSRYADPTHPASSGDLLAFVTGGKLTSQPGLVERSGIKSISTAGRRSAVLEACGVDSGRLGLGLVGGLGFQHLMRRMEDKLLPAEYTVSTEISALSELSRLPYN